MLAGHTVKLLDHLQIARADIVAHSMGGMLAVRLARSYPARVDRIVLEAPIGLEDYRNFAPPVETARIIADEDRLTADAYRNQLMTNYSLTLAARSDHPVHRSAHADQGKRGISRAGSTPSSTPTR